MSEKVISYLKTKVLAQKSFAKDEHLFRRDDPVRMLFLITGGYVNLIRFQADGNQALLQRSTAGTVLAEASLFSERYHCDAVAAEATDAELVPVAEVRRLLERDLVFAGEWMSHLSRELLSVRKRSEIAALRTVSARLDAWIAWNDDAFPSRGDWRGLANELGVSSEALYRELSKRRRSGSLRRLTQER